MRTLLIIITLLYCAVIPASAQKKTTKKQKGESHAPSNKTADTQSPKSNNKNLTRAESAMQLYNEAKALRSKYYKSDDAKEKNLVISKYKDAGKAFLAADSFKNSPEKLYLQSYALLSYTSAMFLMRTNGKEKEVLSLADEITPKFWMATEKLPKEAKSLVAKDSILITPDKFKTFRSEYFEEIIAAAVAKENWKYQLKYGPKYLSILPPPESKSDVKLVNERMKILALNAISSIKLKNADSCRRHVGEPFNFVVTKRSMIADKDGVLKTLRSIDTMLSNNPKFNYTDFDNDAKIRAQAARAFDKLDDHDFAYRLYDQTIKSGNKSLSLYMARAESAANMNDMAKLDIAVLAIDEKLYTGKMSEEYERRIREYKRLLKKGE